MNEGCACGGETVLTIQLKFANFSVGVCSVLLFILCLPLCSETSAESERTVDFAGYQWQTKHSPRYPVGPGPNYWSESRRNVWVDEAGSLHLRIVKRRDTWHCAEVFLENPLGFGEYVFEMECPTGELRGPVVVGLFNYLSDREEIDIEIMENQDRSEPAVYFVVQPHQKSGHVHRTPLNCAGEWIRLSFDWNQNRVSFRGERFTEDDSGLNPEQFAEWSFSGPDLPTEDLTTHINLWLREGSSPEAGREPEIVLRDFSFTPESEN
ncbi:MAG: glycoside hydrolase family 16 protein [Candidatus Acetothermia bacterium]